MAAEGGLRGLGPLAEVGVVPQVLQIPVHERPVGGERQAADDGREDRRAPHRATEEISHARRRLGSGRPCGMPFLRLWHGPSDPDHEKRRQHANEEHRPRRESRQEKAGHHRQHYSHVDGRLQHRRHPGAPTAGPRFRDEGRPHRPLASDPKRRKEPADEQLPPRLGEEREPGEQGVREDRHVQGPRAADSVADATEEAAAERPAHEEARLHDRARAAYRGIPLVEAPEQFGYEGGSHERVEVHVEAVKQPAKPGGDAALPLLR